MERSEPGTIRDEELLAYLAGEKVQSEVQQHLLNCKQCSSRLEEYRRLELSLTSKQYRWDCPPNQVLGEYQLGLLSNDLTAAVKSHLSTCVLCATEMGILAQFIENQAEPVFTDIERYDIKELLERSANLDSGIEQVEERAYLDNALASGKQGEVFGHLFYIFLVDAIKAQLKQQDKKSDIIPNQEGMKPGAEGEKGGQQTSQEAISTFTTPQVYPPYIRLHYEIEKAGAYQLLNPERARLLQTYLSTEQTMSDIKRAEGFKSKSGVHANIHKSLETIFSQLPEHVRQEFGSAKDAIKTKSTHHTESSKRRLRQGLDRLKRDDLETIEFSSTHIQNLSEAASRRWQREREANKAEQKANQE